MKTEKGTGKYKTTDLYPNVSFVMPAYNASQTVRDSVESIFNENYQKGDEVIIVNDCSTDDTLLILKKLKIKYPVIHIINNLTNKGAPASRNIGISRAKNNYIFNLDSDDVLVTGSRFDLESCLIKNKADMAVFGESRFFQTDINEITHIWIFKPGFMGLNDFLSSNKIPGQNCLYTKESWYKIGGYWEYDLGLLEDWGFFLKQIVCGSKIFVLSGKFYYHRYGRNSLFVRETSKGSSMDTKMASRMIAPFLGLLDSKDAEFVKSERGRDRWFENLRRKPLRVKGMPLGRGHKVKYYYLTILKVYFRKFLLSLKKTLYMIIKGSYKDIYGIKKE